MGFFSSFKKWLREEETEASIEGYYGPMTKEFKDFHPYKDPSMGPMPPYDPSVGVTKKYNDPALQGTAPYDPSTGMTKAYDVTTGVNKGYDVNTGIYKPYDHATGRQHPYDIPSGLKEGYDPLTGFLSARKTRRQRFFKWLFGGGNPP